jgi:predicted RecA/RadA family phage recombinase
MAEVTKGVIPSLSTPAASPPDLISGLLAGEDIAAGDAVYLKNDGKIWKATGAAANAAAKCIGFAVKAASAGEAVTVARVNSGIMIGYHPKVGGSDVAAGTPLYLSGTVAGGLADAASTGGTAPIAIAIGDGRIMLGATVP